MEARPRRLASASLGERRGVSPTWGQRGPRRTLRAAVHYIMYARSGYPIHSTNSFAWHSAQSCGMTSSMDLSSPAPTTFASFVPAAADCGWWSQLNNHNARPVPARKLSQPPLREPPPPPLTPRRWTNLHTRASMSTGCGRGRTDHNMLSQTAKTRGRSLVARTLAFSGAAGRRIARASPGSGRSGRKAGRVFNSSDPFSALVSGARRQRKYGVPFGVSLRRLAGRLLAEPTLLADTSLRKQGRDRHCFVRRNSGRETNGGHAHVTKPHSQP